MSRHNGIRVDLDTIRDPHHRPRTTAGTGPTDDDIAAEINEAGITFDEWYRDLHPNHDDPID